MEKTSTGLDANVAGLLCYVLGWISGLVFILIEKDNKFVRFHAVQSIVTFGIINIALIVFSRLATIHWIGILFGIVTGIIGLLAFALWIVLMIKAYQGTMFKLPRVGNFAEERTK